MRAPDASDGKQRRGTPDVGCLVVAASPLKSGFYSLWSCAPAAVGGSICGRFRSNDLGIVVDTCVFDDGQACAYILTSHGVSGWISCGLLMVVSEATTLT